MASSSTENLSDRRRVRFDLPEEELVVDGATNVSDTVGFVKPRRSPRRRGGITDPPTEAGERKQVTASDPADPQSKKSVAREVGDATTQRITLGDWIELFWETRNVIGGIMATFAVTGLWLIQHEGHVAEFAWILCSFMCWGGLFFAASRTVKQPMQSREQRRAAAQRK
eukprot:TRINITY_DN8720_c1_g5_i1.p3 TRINITY_DN8720_c1_g5~~TRINITY_DN8720_c1_g5_i1.p3  ORF type:complete len:169 (-),score=22.84 TRINITY_DN8720_c1_g5_i1:74-580(-)